MGQHGLAISIAQRTLPHDHDTGHALLVRMILGCKLGQSLAPRTQIHDRIGQIGSGSDNRHRCTPGPGLADSRIQHRRLSPRVRPDQQDLLGRIQILDLRRPDIARAIADRQLGPVRPASASALPP